MKLTSAAANKWIKSLEVEKSYQLSLETSSSTYILTEGEKIEKPEYDYIKVSKRIAELDGKIRKIRHAVNLFNATTVLPEINVTIDESLVMMAQLNVRKAKLDIMRRKLPKERVSPMFPGSKSMVEYQYANYDINQVNEDYMRISEKITKIQLALDICNQTQSFDIDIEE